jgi:hypothetical protein
VDGKDDDFSHRANRTITAGARKTARGVRISSDYEFAIHRLTAPTAAVAGLPTNEVRYG